MWTDDEIKGKILHKLTRLGKFKHSHTSIDNLPKGFPAHEIGRAKTLIKDMKKEQLLLAKPTSYGEEVSINLEKTGEIHKLIETFLKKI
ncbi:MAG: hypothetical protein FJY77_03585 [Candidatus Altiarchaeales archaeon]|nr:hypothetical protein [Candidatus Altiarchaeales archaeon]